MKIITWLLTSSADPQRTSMFVKASLFSLVPITMQALSFTCGLHLVCTDVTGDELKTVAETFANLVFFVTSAVSAFGAFYGLMRKLVLGRWSAAS